MKTRLLFLALAFFCSRLVAQDYHEINFSGINADPDLVFVKNLTQGTELLMAGNKTLRLVMQNVSVPGQQVFTKRELNIFPNPFEHYCHIEFINERTGRVHIQIFGITGRLIYQYTSELALGQHSFLLAGVPAGLYIVKVQTSTRLQSGKFVATGQGKGAVSLQHTSEAPLKITWAENDLPTAPTSLGSGKGNDIVEMDFFTGDEMLFIGIADGFGNTGMYASPGEKQNYSFNFHPYVHCDEPTEIVDVTNPITGLTWMDRNLGASQVATSTDDEAAFGYLFQWGRFADGHQCRNSATTSLVSDIDQPPHSDFIITSEPDYDWRIPQHDNLWQGMYGINNPCPAGYRLPTESEFEAERLSWSSNDKEGAFDSPLKLPSPSNRHFDNGAIFYDGYTSYITSSISGIGVRTLGFSHADANVDDYVRAYGYPVRCIKHIPSSPGTIGSLDCNGASVEGSIVEGHYANNVSLSVSYTGGNGDEHYGQIEPSSGIKGLTATLAPGTFAEGDGTLTYIISGLPQGSGTASFALSIGGQACIASVAIEPYCWSSFNTTEVVDVVNPITGRVWMDRNLGAARVAESSDDPLSYGDLFQWGRAADGHECRNSETTTELSTSDQPGHGDFILAPDPPNYDWRNPQNDDLWQGVEGINNPCPTGYRIPTDSEWYEEIASWTTDNANSAFDSPLKLPVAGTRHYPNGSVEDFGYFGAYISSSVNGEWAIYLGFDKHQVSIVSHSRAQGYSVRCIKD